MAVSSNLTKIIKQKNLIFDYLNETFVFSKKQFITNVFIALSVFIKNKQKRILSSLLTRKLWLRVNPGGTPCIYV